MNYEGVYRTAPATPGLLNTKILYFLHLIIKSIIHFKYKVNIAKLPDWLEEGCILCWVPSPQLQVVLWCYIISTKDFIVLSGTRVYPKTGTRFS